MVRMSAFGHKQTFLWKRDRGRVLKLVLRHFLAVHGQHTCAAFPQTRTIGLEVEDDGVFAGRQLGPFRNMRKIRCAFRAASGRDHRYQRQKRANDECERENLTRVFSNVAHGPLQSLESLSAY